MIPKTIHYCWFGRNPLPKTSINCIESWKKYCPDYEIIEWNENNFDVNMNAYTQYCYREKKWAFLSDFVRLFVVFHQGGVYFDTDVELIRNIDSLLFYQSYFGFENTDYVATGLGFGGEKESKAVGVMLDEYYQINPLDNGDFQLLSCPQLNTKALLSIGLVTNGKRQSIIGAEIFPVEYFNPLDDATGKLKITENTYSINHYAKSWVSNHLKIRSIIMRPVHAIFGVDTFKKFRKR